MSSLLESDRWCKKNEQDKEGPGWVANLNQGRSLWEGGILIISEESTGGSHGEIWGQRDSKHKDSETGECWLCAGDGAESRWLEQTKGGGEEQEGGERGEAEPDHLGPWRPMEVLGFSCGWGAVSCSEKLCGQAYVFKESTGMSAW